MDNLPTKPSAKLAKPPPTPLPKPLIDPYGRAITYLRVSVTDRCDFRCVYCMAENMTFLPKHDLLTLEELATLCRAFMSLGVRKIRLTGGEPLVRRNILWLVEYLGDYVKRGALDEVTLTTNASQLTAMAESLAKAGVARINVSLDTLDAAKFKAITRRGELAVVLDGIRAAREAGLAVKINAVALRGVNEGELGDMVAWCGREGLDMTIIEVMPMGDIGGDAGEGGGKSGGGSQGIAPEIAGDISGSVGGSGRETQYLPLTEVREMLGRRFTLIPSTHRTGGPARYVEVAETGRRLGFITPLTHNFCESCNRVRVTCTGVMYMCLGQEDKADLREVLRAEGEAGLVAAVRRAITRKPKGHDFVIDRVAVPRYMSTTGG
ncbi:MAG: radical SAM protein [Proteobacteria bacterium]|nr:radical SAM protein [Pseudomonadota bacterium]